jgi:predicted dehydrogenase
MTTTPSPLRLIQCGAGGFGAHWLQQISTKSADFDLVALVDVSTAALDAAATKHNISRDRLFSSLEQALERVKADAVLTVTPPHVHLHHARLAFQHQLHFMTEKPIADTMEHAREMVALAKAAGKQIVVSQNYRYNPPVQTMTRTLASGLLGAFGHGRMDFYIPADFTGSFRETMEDVLIMDMAVHHFDLIRHVTGRNITRVHARSFRPAWSWYQRQSAAHVMLELEGGLPFTYTGDWSGRGRSTSWNGTWRLQCAEGSLHLDDDNVVRAARCERWSQNPREEIVPEVTQQLTGQAATLHAFAEAIRTGHPAPTSGEDNLKTLAAVTAAIRSSREGRTVETSELLC